jgi:hypothetical protein
VSFLPRNHDKPFEFSLKPLYTKIEREICKMNELFISQMELETDEGFLFEDSHLSKHQVIQNILKDSYIKNPNDDCWVEVEIFTSESTEKLYRSYMKIPDLLAQLGGMLKSFTVFFSIILKLIYTRRMNEHIIRTIYDINHDEVIKEIFAKLISPDFKDKPIELENILNNNKNKNQNDINNENNNKINKNNDNYKNQALNEGVNTLNKNNNSPLNNTPEKLLNRDPEKSIITPKSPRTKSLILEYPSHLDLNQNSNRSLNILKVNPPSKNLNSPKKSKNKYFFNVWENLLLTICKCFTTRRLKALDKYYDRLRTLSIMNTDVLNMVKKFTDVDKTLYLMNINFHCSTVLPN